MPKAMLQTEPSPNVAPADRRRAPRDAAQMEIWLIPGFGEPLVRCRCTDLSAVGVRLRAEGRPRLRPGQHCELCAHLPGTSPPASVRGFISRGGTIVRADVVGDGPDGVELGVALDAWNAAEDDRD